MKRLLLCILITTTTHPMHYARRMASGGATLLHWAFCFSPTLLIGSSLAGKKHLERPTFQEKNRYFFPDYFKENPQAQDLCSDFLHQAGPNDVKVVPSNFASNAGFNTIFINQNLLQAACESSEKCNEKRLKGVLHHEANHILHGDITWRLLAAALAAPLITHAGAKGLTTVMKLLSIPSFTRLARTRKILSGMGKGIAASHLYCYCSRKFEQQADDAICDQDAIEGMILFLKEHDECILRSFENRPNMLKLYKEYPICLGPTHPTIKTRVEKLEERLEE